MMKSFLFGHISHRPYIHFIYSASQKPLKRIEKCNDVEVLTSSPCRHTQHKKPKKKMSNLLRLYTKRQRRENLSTQREKQWRNTARSKQYSSRSIRDLYSLCRYVQYKYTRQIHQRPISKREKRLWFARVSIDTCIVYLGQQLLKISTWQ
jgi:hypothetical protein